MNELLSSKALFEELELRDPNDSFSLHPHHESDHQIQFTLETKPPQPFVPQPTSIHWKVRAHNVKGVWRNTVDFSKRIEADWELPHQESRISIDSPIVCLFGHEDENILTFCCSNAVNRIDLGAKYREEDNCFHCYFLFFTECQYEIEAFSAQIRLDFTRTHFSHVLGDVANWWEDQGLIPMAVPEIAYRPLYSTWYQFHQNLDLDLIEKECKLAKDLGFDSLIIDDGWQTKDSNRGYDYTGDWKPERIADMRQFVQRLQSLGMKVATWYSVPFCGVKSTAYQRFKGKFLTENHRWAPVFDPRYPEVRNYLVDIYKRAVLDFGLDGLKLDFIDDFRSYPETPFGGPSERDVESISDAVDRLLNEVKTELLEINPDIFIEFRQKYVGPAIRQYGNMLRAFDCPGDPTMNRVRTTDIRMLANKTAVHSDMVTWHFDEPVETVAIHLLSTFFSVPQLSILLTEAPDEHLRLVRFYMGYWRDRAEVLLEGDFKPSRPLGNYPILQSRKDGVEIVGIYDDQVVRVKEPFQELDILNGKATSEVILNLEGQSGRFRLDICDCLGQTDHATTTDLNEGVHCWQVPAGGMLTLTAT